MIIHFTTVHSRVDDRIRFKQVASLSDNFQQKITLYVQDGLGDERDINHGYDIIDTGPRMGRVKRMTVGAWTMFNAVRKARPDIAHFHDPELLPWSILLKFFGIKVIYDVHEDYPQVVLHNTNIPRFVRLVLSKLVRFMEWLSMFFVDGIVTVTPKINGKFAGANSIMVRNFPDISEFKVQADTPMVDRAKEFVYLGTISRNRNIIGMINAVEQLKSSEVALRLAGPFHFKDDEILARSLTGWQGVHYEGIVNRERVMQILTSSRAGLVVLRPIAHEMESYPIKLFEYMAAGLPIISSNFPIWRQIVEETNSGLLVNPDSTDEITDALQWILDHPVEAQEMGKRGQQAVRLRYNWQNEVKNLVAFYKSLLKKEC
jgi:glycosyltransferase involved in cell wall biosynthesis